MLTSRSDVWWSSPRIGVPKYSQIRIRVTRDAAARLGAEMQHGSRIKPEAVACVDTTKPSEATGPRPDDARRRERRPRTYGTSSRKTLRRTRSSVPRAVVAVGARVGAALSCQQQSGGESKQRDVARLREEAQRASKYRRRFTNDRRLGKSIPHFRLRR